MTKKDLERRNKFLMLQLKKIQKWIKDIEKLNNDDMFRQLGKIEYNSDPETIKKLIQYIEENNLEYNFFDKTH